MYAFECTQRKLSFRLSLRPSTVTWCRHTYKVPNNVTARNTAKLCSTLSHFKRVQISNLILTCPGRGICSWSTRPCNYRQSPTPFCLSSQYIMAQGTHQYKHCFLVVFGAGTGKGQPVGARNDAWISAPFPSIIPSLQLPSYVSWT